MKRACERCSAKDLERAVSAINSGDMDLCRAASMYNIPKSTLSRHSGKHMIADDDVKFYGHAHTFPWNLENELVQHCIMLSPCISDFVLMICGVLLEIWQSKFISTQLLQE